MQIKNNLLFIVLVLFCSGVYKVGASESSQIMPAMPETNDWIDTALAQKMMLDFRFYCEPGDLTKSTQKALKKQSCRDPLTTLNPAIKQFIEESEVGGVILFSENIQNAKQVTQLNKQFQLAASHSNSGLPLFIGVDQEGGRVARLPRAEYPAFPGNMAIGATYQLFKDSYAIEVGQAIGQQLYHLGFNLNFAPNVDVNNNPNNPVINVRSFGDNAEVVAELGQAVSEGMRSANILTTAKHFPGHGNTSIDSHSGLSAVTSSLQNLENVELQPFRFLSEANAVDFVMSAHIQFPVLDNSQITSKTGVKITRPATLSRKIITGLLKEEFGFKGLVISDALDMGAIAKHFTAEQALVETFNAGVDIALMPMVIDSPSQIQAFTRLLAKLKGKVLTGDIKKQALWSSYQNILATKSRLKTKIQDQFKDPNSQNLAVLMREKHQALHQRLSDKSLTLLKGNGHLAIYRQETNQYKEHGIYRLLVVMPDSGKCDAFLNAMNNAKELKEAMNPSVKTVELSCLSDTSLFRTDLAASRSLESLLGGTKNTTSSKTFDGLLIGSISPKQSPYEMVGVDQTERRQLSLISTNRKNTFYKVLFKKAKSLGLQTFFVSLRAPYEVEYFKAQVDSVMSTYSYNVYIEPDAAKSNMENKVIKGEVYESIAKQLFGLIKGAGKSPVKTAKEIQHCCK